MSERLAHTPGRPRRTVPLVVVFVSALVGCGCDDDPRLGQVTGRVTLDGEPLPGALVQFQPDHGRSSFGETDAVGNYELSYLPAKPGAVVGPHTVRVTSSRELSTVAEAKLDTGGASNGAASKVGLTKERVPPRFNVNSELRKTVERGKNNMDLELKSGP